MSLTININGLTLCHKGSNGISQNTLPDVCKTPPYSVPIPYGNLAFSKDLVQGTHSVFADGGNMIAHNKSNFATSILDEPGSIGGVVSGVNRSKAEWISHSFDVFFEGKPACRLTDKMFMNKKNTVNMAGLLQAPLENWPELMVLCAIICFCNKNAGTGATGQKLKQQCVDSKLNALKAGSITAQELGVPENLTQFTNTIHPEIAYDMTKTPPSPLLSNALLERGELARSGFLSKRMINEGLKSARNNGGTYQVRIPDASLTLPIKKSELTALQNNTERTALFRSRLKGVVEIKFDQSVDNQQILDYEKITGGQDSVTELSPKACRCDIEDAYERVYVLTKEYERENESLWDKLKRVVGEAYDEVGVATGLTGAALVIYFIISEGSRLYPPRNLVPVP